MHPFRKVALCFTLDVQCNGKVNTGSVYSTSSLLMNMGFKSFQPTYIHIFILCSLCLLYSSYKVLIL
jgi:hypothetical protein